MNGHRRQVLINQKHSKRLLFFFNGNQIINSFFQNLPGKNFIAVQCNRHN